MQNQWIQPPVDSSLNSDSYDIQINYKRSLWDSLMVLDGTLFKHMSREYKFRFNDIIPDQAATPKTQPPSLNSYRHHQSNDGAWIGQPHSSMQNSIGQSQNPNSNIEWIGQHQIIHLGGSRDKRHKQSVNNQNGSPQNPSSSSKDTTIDKQQAVSSWQPLA